MQEFVQYWLRTYDWPRWEAKLNSLHQYTATVNGISMHFVHERSNKPNAIPLLLLHGEAMHLQQAVLQHYAAAPFSGDKMSTACHALTCSSAVPPHTYTIRIRATVGKHHAPGCCYIIDTAGWPGSYFEFYKLIPLLKADGRFHIVAPSLPGDNSSRWQEFGTQRQHAWLPIDLYSGRDAFGRAGMLHSPVAAQRDYKMCNPEQTV